MVVCVYVADLSGELGCLTAVIELFD